jgi:hypothetical protein
MEEEFKMNESKSEKKAIIFPLGQIVATQGAIQALEEAKQSYIEFLARHQRGDWGVVCAEDCELNNLAVKNETRLLSAYRTSKDERILVITEADRSATTLLLPDEY